ncbi:hypothetical protein AAAU25_13380 [Phocaeicola vulgatus]|uniref:hypothetical protein n=1 Tax=Bacteroides cellulolyticus TaxID=2981780 RepID=UPI0012AB432E|nr:hypothetical protein [Bacteroides cellulolyticus]MCU6772484.1 hypothetical protein [Bacteroides cellulolyticus]
MPYTTETYWLTCFVSRYQASFSQQVHPIMQINQAVAKDRTFKVTLLFTSKALTLVTDFR